MSVYRYVQAELELARRNRIVGPTIYDQEFIVALGISADDIGQRRASRALTYHDSPALLRSAPSRAGDCTSLR